MNGTADGNVDDGKDTALPVMVSAVIDAIGVITVGEVVEVVKVVEAVDGGIVGVGMHGCGNWPFGGIRVLSELTVVMCQQELHSRLAGHADLGRKPTDRYSKEYSRPV